RSPDRSKRSAFLSEVDLWRKFALCMGVLAGLEVIDDLAPAFASARDSQALVRLVGRQTWSRAAVHGIPRPTGLASGWIDPPPPRLARLSYKVDAVLKSVGVVKPDQPSRLVTRA